MTNRKKVSIIVPIYNAETTIRQCLEHIQKQSYDFLEILCVNDGSKDDSQKIIEKMAEEDSRIVVINKENGGVSSARNKGIEYATGCYIQFVDSDDLIDHDMVEILVSALEDSKSQMAICGYRFSNGQPDRIPMQGNWTKEEFIEQFHMYYTGGFVCSPWNKLFIKELIKSKFPEDMNLGEDAVFNMSYIMSAQKICMVHCAPYYYEVGNLNSLSWKYNEKALYCEKKKDSYIEECLLESGTLKELKKMQKEFCKDFQRCVDNEILSGKYSKRELQERIYNNVSDSFWQHVLRESGYLQGTTEDDTKKGINRYVRKMMFYRHYMFIRSEIKKIVKGRILCREQNKV